MNARSMTLVGRFVALVALGGVFGMAGSSCADTGTVRAMIGGALASPTGTSADGQLTVRMGVTRPVSLVTDGGVVAGSIGTATFAQWTNSSTSAGPTTHHLMVFHLGGGWMIVAAGTTTPAGVLTTFSSTAPFERLSGSWALTSGVGVTGAGADDALVTFAFDTNPGPPVLSSRLLTGDLGVYVEAVEPPVALDTLGVSGGTHRLNLDENGRRVGTLTSYTAAHELAGGTFEPVELGAVDFEDGVVMLFGCARPEGTASLVCLVGGASTAAAGSSISHLSGRVHQSTAVYTCTAPSANVFFSLCEVLILDFSLALP